LFALVLALLLLYSLRTDLDFIGDMADSVAQTEHGYDHDNLRHVVITATCFAFILSTTAVGFRIISRAINGTGLFVDDWLIIFALVCRCRLVCLMMLSNNLCSCSNMDWLSLALSVC
jgi:hypothetical protein